MKIIRRFSILLVVLLSMVAAGQTTVASKTFTVKLIRPGSGETIWTGEINMPEDGILKPALPTLPDELVFMEIVYADG